MSLVDDLEHLGTGTSVKSASSHRAEIHRAEAPESSESSNANHLLVV